MGVNAKPQSVRLSNATKSQQRLPWSRLGESTKPDGTITQKPSDANANGTCKGVSRNHSAAPPRVEHKHWVWMQNHSLFVSQKEMPPSCCRCFEPRSIIVEETRTQKPRSSPIRACRQDCRPKLRGSRDRTEAKRKPTQRKKRKLDRQQNGKNPTVNDHEWSKG